MVAVDYGREHVLQCPTVEMQDETKSVQPSDEVDKRLSECGCVARG